MEATPNPELVEWLLDLNQQVSEAEETERIKIIKDLKESMDELFLDGKIDPLYFFISMRFLILPDLLEAGGIDLHESLDDYFFNEIFEVTKTPEQLLHFSQVMFPFAKKMGFSPLANDRVLRLINEVIAGEVLPMMDMKIKMTPPETFGELASFLYPYIKDAMEQPFAQEDVIIEDEKGKRPCGKKFHILCLIKDILLKLSLPTITPELS